MVLTSCSVPIFVTNMLLRFKKQLKKFPSNMVAKQKIRLWKDWCNALLSKTILVVIKSTMEDHGLNLSGVFINI